LQFVTVQSIQRAKGQRVHPVAATWAELLEGVMNFEKTCLSVKV
jgi:hypothetical protein